MGKFPAPDFAGGDDAGAVFTACQMEAGDITNFSTVWGVGRRDHKSVSGASLLSDEERFPTPGRILVNTGPSFWSRLRVARRRSHRGGLLLSGLRVPELD